MQVRMVMRDAETKDQATRNTEVHEEKPGTAWWLALEFSWGDYPLFAVTLSRSLHKQGFGERRKAAMSKPLFQNPYPPGPFIPFVVRLHYPNGAKGFQKQRKVVWFTDCTIESISKTRTPMPQEISVSYQAIKSKVYRLIDALVVGEKNESEVQESIRRWWDLIHPADRPIAQKYLLMVLGRSVSALDAVGDGLLSAGGAESPYSHIAHTQLPTKRMRLMERMVKETGVRSAV